jgi:superfamily II DNA or RNA helicase
MTIRSGIWNWSLDHGQICQVIEAQTLWGEPICRVWLPGRNSVVQIPASRLIPLENAGINSSDYIAYIAAAARIADAVTQDMLLAPLGTSLIPLPHQIRALSRALADDHIRYLLADEVGLGKTIEAGLIMRELKLRGLVKRTLVIAPKGLVTQWVGEMRLHFGEAFKLVLPEDLKTLKRIGSTPGSINMEYPYYQETFLDNAWQLFSQVIVPMDSVKPIDKRRGWTTGDVEKHNRERFEDLISAGWDLIIVDEAHRLGGSTEQVARHKLGQGLSEASPYLLLLSATPHQGKTDAFHRLVSLIDTQAFPDVESVVRERVQPYVIRTEKRHAIDPEGKPLFKARHTQLVPVSWEERHRDQRFLYHAVTTYVREGYNQALREKRNYIGFLMLLMQRLVVSSSYAIRTSLEKRLEVLADPYEQLPLFPFYSEEEWADLDGQEQMETLLGTRFKALKNERAEVKLLLEAADRCRQDGPDAKAETLLDWLYRLQAEEGDPDLKVLIFTEFIPTQEMLRQSLTERGFSVVCLNGSMDTEERIRVQEAFAHENRILISTDAGGEGLNLQFCHVVINYDIPWNPMRLEQRIGRVDRIGQTHIVRAVNLVLENSVEYRVLEVLEKKLAIIFEEFGVDKTGDVLDSAQAGKIFDGLYLEAILNPDKVEESVEGVVMQLREQLRETRAGASVLGATEDLNTSEVQELLAHPLPHWVERMTTSYLKANGGKAEMTDRGWKLIWPDGTIYPNVVFSSKEAEKTTTARHLTLEEPKIRDLAMKLPRWVPGQPVLAVSVPGISEEIRGIWSLWEISAINQASKSTGQKVGVVPQDLESETRRRRIMPLFLADNGRVYLPTASYIWDQLLVASPTVRSMLRTERSQEIFERSQKTAEEQGRSAYEELLQEHRARIAHEREKTEYSFAARRKAIEMIGLPEVRNFRMKRLKEEYDQRILNIQKSEAVYPELNCLCILRIENQS